MKEFDITITETLRKKVTVEAESLEDARDIVETAWKNSVYILDAEDFVGVEFTNDEEEN